MTDNVVFCDHSFKVCIFLDGYTDINYITNEKLSIFLAENSASADSL